MYHTAITNSRTLKSCRKISKMTKKDVVSCLQFHIDITNVHNPSDLETVEGFFLYQFINKIGPNLTKCLKWVKF